MKYHILVHLIDHIKRFGPAAGFNEERYEAFHLVVRSASLLSNRRAPSRDIGLRLEYQECMKHIISGGRWIDKQWRVQEASQNVVHFMKTSRVFRQLYGLEKVTPESNPGMIGGSALGVYWITDLNCISCRADSFHAIDAGAEPVRRAGTFCGRDQRTVSRLSNCKISCIFCGRRVRPGGLCPHFKLCGISEFVVVLPYRMISHFITGRQRMLWSHRRDSTGVCFTTNSPCSSLLFALCQCTHI